MNRSRFAFGVVVLAIAAAVAIAVPSARGFSAADVLRALVSRDTSEYERARVPVVDPWT